MYREVKYQLAKKKALESRKNYNKNPLKLPLSPSFIPRGTGYEPSILQLSIQNPHNQKERLKRYKLPNFGANRV